MAKIWPVFEGPEPTIGGPWADIPVSEAVSLFELRPQDFVGIPASTPRFGGPIRDRYAGFKHILVEIRAGESPLSKFKPGFYRSRVKPQEASGRLIEQALIAELGRENVVRATFAPTTNSQGRDALKITVVIRPGATKTLQNGAALNALVRVQERLHEMNDSRTPIVEYATEAELAQDAGP